jgi:hypothetical protein
MWLNWYSIVLLTVPGFLATYAPALLLAVTMIHSRQILRSHAGNSRTTPD